MLMLRILILIRTGIGDFVKRLERIAEECGEQPGKQKKEIQGRQTDNDHES